MAGDIDRYRAILAGYFVQNYFCWFSYATRDHIGDLRGVFFCQRPFFRCVSVCTTLLVIFGGVAFLTDVNTV
jgi:hypothetical protein